MTYAEYSFDFESFNATSVMIQILNLSLNCGAVRQVLHRRGVVDAFASKYIRWHFRSSRPHSYMLVHQWHLLGIFHNQSDALASLCFFNGIDLMLSLRT